MSLLPEETKERINTLFEAQKLNFFKVKAESVNARKAKLIKLKKAISSRENEVVDALIKDLRKPAFESCI